MMGLLSAHSCKVRCRIPNPNQLSSQSSWNNEWILHADFIRWMEGMASQVKEEDNRESPRAMKNEAGGMDWNTMCQRYEESEEERRWEREGGEREGGVERG